MVVFRHSGWTAQYLKNNCADLKIINFLNKELYHYSRFVGTGNRILKDIRSLENLRRYGSLRNKPKGLILSDSSILTNTIFNEGFNATYIKYLNTIKLLVLRSKRARLTAILRPAHGQRRWHNAHMVRICNTFLNVFCKAYELDLFEYGTQRTFRYSKIWEMRQKALVKKKKTKKKFKKFKKFGERRLAKSRKKTPWD